MGGWPRSSRSVRKSSISSVRRRSRGSSRALRFLVGALLVVLFRPLLVVLVLVPGFRLLPIGLEHVPHLFGDARVPHDRTDLPAPIELQPAKTLTADEDFHAVTDDGAHMQARFREFRG